MTEAEIRRSIVGYLGPGADWAAWRIAASLAQAPQRPRLRGDALAAALLRDPAFCELVGFEWRRFVALPDPHGPPAGFAPSPAFSVLDIPRWTTTAALADALGLIPEELDWLADLDGRTARSPNPRLRHYHLSWAPKPCGGRRLIEAPKLRLKRIQRLILDQTLARVPPHADAFAFAAGRSMLRAAGRHAGEAVVLSFDLRRFFQSIPARRVHGIFRRLGYPPSVARTLTGLTTTRVHHVEGSFEERSLLREPHLPQGAPTSPALANLCAYGLDRRLAAFARSAGANYSRYADDLTFSGDAPLGARWVRSAVADIVREEGFRLAPEKTRVQRAGGRQMTTGVVVNAHLNVPREAFDRLKATLTNCLRHGPSTQNRAGHAAFRAHLDGRIGWVESLNPRRGAKLRALFDQIDWTR